MTSEASTIEKRTEPVDRADLLRQVRGVFGADCTTQLYGSGGRIVAEDGRRLTFDSLEELKELIDRERSEPQREPLTEAGCWRGTPAPR